MASPKGLPEIPIKNNTEKQPLQARFRALIPRRKPLVLIIARIATQNYGG